MKENETSVPVIGIWGLIFIYVFLCILTVLLSKTFFADILQDGRITDRLMLVVFFTIPAVLFIFLIISLVRLAQDFITRKTGRRFQARLLGYFTIVLLFSAIPLVLITTLSTTEIMRFWNTLDMESTMNYAQQFVMDAYSLHLEKAQNIVDNTDFDQIFDNPSTPLPDGLIAIQDFEMSPSSVEGKADGGAEDEAQWTSVRFWGKADQALDAPPAQFQGFVTRQKNRDTDVVRRLIVTSDRTARLITYDLGEGFDAAIDGFETQRARFDALKTLNIQFKEILFFFYAIFFLPAVLLTLIIAISFTKTITKPIADLTEATRKVANGDFSISIRAKKNDEFGILIRSFNTMVRDLEKTRNSLIKAETISIWRQMAVQLAHEIKNPLTPIKLTAERVLRRWQNAPEKTGEILESSMFSIIQEVEGLSNMLSEFRILSRPMEPSLSISNVLERIEPFAASYRLSFPAIEFDISNIDCAAAVKVDERRFIQIITNIVINGIDAINAAGLAAADTAGAADATGVKKIEIRTDTVKKQGAVFCRISITDTGQGVPPAAAEKIFTPYFTTKEAGTGLGLPIVERIVSDHGGAIWFNSSPNLGTTFFVDLPTA
ncbi:MAG: HAMP domain-containing protein [Treponema sp.]|nr:HAMP domain-containing protein [Treponema sp.]